MSNKSARERAERLYKKVDALIITCIGSDDFPMTKAVIPSKNRELLNEIYFATNTSSKFACEVSKNKKTNVYFYRKKLLIWEGCCLLGDMEIITDMKIKEKEWSKKFKDAYPEKSFTDPDFCIIRFIPSKGRYYANFTIDDFEIS